MKRLILCFKIVFYLVLFYYSIVFLNGVFTMAELSFGRLDRSFQGAWIFSIFFISGYCLYSLIKPFSNSTKINLSDARLMVAVPKYKVKIVPIATFKRDFQVLQNGWDGLKEGLNKFCSDFLQENYGIDWNNELYLMPYHTDVSGQFLVELEHVTKKPMRTVIYLNEEIAYACLEYNAYEIAFGVLKHELVHYAMFVLGKQYNDGEDDFEQELKRLRIDSNDMEKTTSYGCYVHRIDEEQSVVKVVLRVNKYTKDIDFDRIVAYYRELTKERESKEKDE